MSYIIIVFKNTHDAMAAETLIIEKGFSIRIMPTPTSITQSCGICVRIDKEEILENVIKIGINFKNIYRRTMDGYELIR